MTEYLPKPIDTSGVKLGDDLEQLAEQLAESTHDHWAAKRMEEGWTCGPKRDDDKRTHPGLIPYGQLSEGEKEYDRVTAIETLKAIVALGYRIEPKA